MIIFLIFVVVILVVIIAYVIKTYNQLVSFRNQVEEGFSTMDVYLMKRYDLIPNLVETVKGYSSHESQTLQDVIKARNTAYSATSVETKIEAQSEIEQTLSRLFALTESYPDLKANTNFLDLQAQLQVVENDIAQSRKYYNGTVNMYNTAVEIFPSSLVAKKFNFTRKNSFVVQNEQQRDNVKVSF